VEFANLRGSQEAGLSQTSGGDEEVAAPAEGLQHIGDGGMETDAQSSKVRKTGRSNSDPEESKPNGQPRRCLDVTHAAREFGFRARTDFDQGLRRTIDYYLASQSQPQLLTR